MGVVKLYATNRHKCIKLAKVTLIVLKIYTNNIKVWVKNKIHCKSILCKPNCV